MQVREQGRGSKKETSKESRSELTMNTQLRCAGAGGGAEGPPGRGMGGAKTQRSRGNEETRKRCRGVSLPRPAAAEGSPQRGRLGREGQQAQACPSMIRDRHCSPLS